MSTAQIFPDQVDDLPSHDVTAEQSVLGAMLSSAEVIVDVEAVMPVSALYLPKHQAIAQAIIDLHQADRAVDPVTVVAELSERGELNRVGGAPYLHTCIATCASPVNATVYAREVVKHAARRRVSELSTAMQQMATTSSLDGLTEMLTSAHERIETTLGEVTPADENPQAGMFRTVVDTVQRRRDNPNELEGIPTGFIDLDTVTNGWRGGQLITVAGRPGMGKSTLLVDYARSASIKHGLHTLYVSYEMSRDELSERILSAEARVRLADMRGGRTDDETLIRLARRAGELEGVEKTLTIVDDSPPISQVMAMAQRMRRRGELDMICLDYLQIAPMDDAGNVTRDRQIGMVTQRLKQLAMRLDIPVLVAAQLNRGVEDRTDKRPRLSDLRESGSIENDADIVVMLHREDYYEADAPRAGEADLILAKHRGGPCSTIAVAHQLHYSRFADLAQE